MWAIALSHSKTFELFQKTHDFSSHFESLSTGTGVKICKAREAKVASEQRPHVFLADGPSEQMKNAISWVYKNLHPQALIGMDLCDDWRTASINQGDLPFFVPTLCLRSAGRIDLGGGPILFEEIPFDPWIQIALSKQILQRTFELDAKSKIFGSDRLIQKSAEKTWLSEQLACQSYDTLSSELLLAGKRLSIKIGCLKVYQEKPDALATLIDSLERLRVPV